MWVIAADRDVTCEVSTMRRMRRRMSIGGANIKNEQEEHNDKEGDDEEDEHEVRSSQLMG